MVDGDSSNGEADERTCCVDDDSASDSDDLEENQPDFNALNPNDVCVDTVCYKENHSCVHRAGAKPH